MDITYINEQGRYRYRVGAIILHDGNILMAKNNVDDYYYSVGGAVKQNELSTDAVVREVYEETGINMQVDRLLFVHENMFWGSGDNGNSVRWHEISLYYLMKPCDSYDIIGNSSNMYGIAEHMEWIPLGDYDTNIRCYPQWLAKELALDNTTVRHIVNNLSS